jgi:hypothetical protein
MADKPLHIGGWRRQITSFTPTHATRPRLCWRPQVAPGGTGILGSRVHGGYIACSDSAVNSVNVMWGQVLVGNGAAGLAFASSATITRTSGSFVGDGVAVGDTLLVDGATTAANGVLAEVTAVTATTLTVSGTPFTVESVPAAAELVRIGQAALIGVSASAGFAASNWSVPLLSQAAMPWLAASPDTNEIMGPNDRVYAALTGTLAAGKKAQVTFLGGDY